MNLIGRIGLLNATDLFSLGLQRLWILI